MKTYKWIMFSFYLSEIYRDHFWMGLNQVQKISYKY